GGPVSGVWFRRVGGSGTALFDSVNWNGRWSRFDGYTVRYLRTLSATTGRTIFPAATGRRVGYRLTNASSSLRVLRVVGGAGTEWRPVQRPGGGSAVFADSAGDGEDVTYRLVGPPKTEAAALALETPVTADGVITDLADGSIGGTRQDPEYLIVAP